MKRGPTVRLASSADEACWVSEPPALLLSSRAMPGHGPHRFRAKHTLGRLAIVFVCGLLMALLVWWPMLANYPHTPDLDGHFVFFQLESARAPLLRYHELPLWNPFDCRGVPLWDNPENITSSPLFFLTLPFGALFQYYAFILFHCAIGFTGTWLLARDDLRLGPPAALVAATAFALAAGQTFQVAGGHVAFVGFWNFPLLVYLWRRAESDSRAAVGVGLVYAWMFYQGATYPLPFCTVGLVLEALTRLTSPRRILAIARAGLILVVTALPLAAARLLPLMEQFRAHKRPNPHPDVDTITLKNLWAMLTFRSLEWSSHLPGQQYVLNEYVSYIGYVGVGLVVIGAALAVRRAPWVLALSLLILIVMLGHFAKWSPWSLLNHHVFPFQSMRVPSRFRLILAAPGALLLAIAVEEGPRLLFRITGASKIATFARPFLLAMAFLAIGDAVAFGVSKVQMHFVGAAPAKLPASEHFYYGGPGLAHDFIDVAPQNRGWLGCRGYEWVFHGNAPLWQGDVPQARAKTDGLQITNVRRTHNTFTIDVQAAEAGRVLLNSAYDVGWQTSVGTVAEDSDLLAIDVPPGTHHIKVRYWPSKLTLGFSLAGLATFAIAAFFVMDARRRRRTPLPSASLDRASRRE